MPAGPENVSTLGELCEWLKQRVRWLRDWHMAPKNPKPIPPAFLDTIRSLYGESNYPAPRDPARLCEWANVWIEKFSIHTIHEAHDWLETHGIFGAPDWHGNENPRILIEALEHLSALLNFIGIRAGAQLTPDYNYKGEMVIHDGVFVLAIFRDLEALDDACLDFLSADNEQPRDQQLVSKNLRKMNDCKTRLLSHDLLRLDRLAVQILKSRPGEWGIRFREDLLGSPGDTVSQLHGRVRHRYPQLHALADLLAGAQPPATDAGNLLADSATPNNSLIARNQPDGPQSGCWVWWKGTRHDVPKGVVYRLLEFMWGRESTTYVDLKRPVFDDNSVSPSTIRGRVSELNQVLEKVGIPWRLKTDSIARCLTKHPSS